MFTGLVVEMGECVRVAADQESARLEIRAPHLAPIAGMGDSIAINGCCLTVVGNTAGVLAFDLLAETLRRTNLGQLSPGGKVNLEPALAAGDRLGGHFVQGHVDTTARLLDFSAHGADYRLEIELPPAFAQYVTYKGSIAVDGISLTVAEVTPQSFVCWIIPHTRAGTNLSDRRAGDLVNLEFDMLAKYVERILQVREAR